MPLIKSAKKKLLQDKKRTKYNKKYELAIKSALKQIKKQKGDAKKAVQKLYSAIDKALKKKIIHKNKANRLKAQATKLARSFSKKKQVQSK